ASNESVHEQAAIAVGAAAGERQTYALAQHQAFELSARALRQRPVDEGASSVVGAWRQSADQACFATAVEQQCLAVEHPGHGTVLTVVEPALLRGLPGARGIVHAWLRSRAGRDGGHGSEGRAECGPCRAPRE